MSNELSFEDAKKILSAERDRYIDRALDQALDFYVNLSQEERKVHLDELRTKADFDKQAMNEGKSEKLIEKAISLSKKYGYEITPKGRGFNSLVIGLSDIKNNTHLYKKGVYDRLMTETFEELPTNPYLNKIAETNEVEEFKEDETPKEIAPDPKSSKLSDVFDEFIKYRIRRLTAFVLSSC